jgi:hypothetical protein
MSGYVTRWKKKRRKVGGFDETRLEGVCVDYDRRRK